MFYRKEYQAGHSPRDAALLDRSIENVKRETLAMLKAGVCGLDQATRELRQAGCFEAEISELLGRGATVNVVA